MNDLETLAPPAWTGPTMGRLDTLAERGEIYLCSRGACEAFLYFLGIEALRPPVIVSLNTREAALLWVGGDHDVQVKPFWTRAGNLRFQLAVSSAGCAPYERACTSLDQVRTALALAFECVRREMADAADWVREWGG